MFQRKVSFKEAVMRAITVNYCNFNGRASRSEYWWFCLFAFIVGVVVEIVFSFSTTTMTAVSGIVSLALLLPGLGLGVRRLHDIGKSGWFLLLALIPFVGAIILLILFCQDSVKNENQYGPVPNVA